MIELSTILQEHQAMVTNLEPMAFQIEQIASRMSAALSNGGKIFWMGNGGSAADSQHLAAELVGRFSRERSAISSIALTTDTSILTALANDYGFDTVFSRQLEALCSVDDVVVGISTSGNSENVMRGIKKAREIGAYTVGLSGGEGGQLKDKADTCLVIPSPTTARIQEGHILVGHILCDWIEATFTSFTGAL